MMNEYNSVADKIGVIGKTSAIIDFATGTDSATWDAANAKKALGVTSDALSRSYILGGSASAFELVFLIAPTTD